MCFSEVWLSEKSYSTVHCVIGLVPKINESQHLGWLLLVQYKHTHMVAPYFYVFNTHLSRCVFMPLSHPVFGIVTVSAPFSHLVMMTRTVLEITLNSSPDQYHLTMRSRTCFWSFLQNMASGVRWHQKKEEIPLKQLIFDLLLMRIPLLMTDACMSMCLFNADINSICM